ncbi:MAG: tetratricopeptide repeat protein [Ignavibacteriaceae bacterium]|nr:tetratricopeptide repeat protein [Ignavibacteriaceae bacterium]
MKKILFFLLPVFLFCGCGLWSDFTTYFNIYYDAADNFAQAEQLIKEQKRDLFSTEEVPLPGSAAQLLTKVIEKASKILQFHSQSAYVDNSLMLLGKSLYYQKDFLKAMRKFQELQTSKPNSGFILESRLWVGKSQMRMRQFDAAMKTLNDVKDEAVSKKESDIYEDAYLEQIKYRVITEDYDLAISLINEFLKVSTTNEISGQVSFELGKLYTKQNDPKDAIIAFQNVFNYSPSYDLNLNTKIELSKALRKNGDPQKALDIMQAMKREIKYTEFFHKIDLEIALNLIDLKRIDEGIQALVKIDTSYASTTSAGLARFELGKIFETRIPIYDSASTYYTKASLSTGSDPQMLVMANEKAQLFKKYQYKRSFIEDNKKQLYYVINPEEFVKDSIAFYPDSVSKAHQNETLNQDKTVNINNEKNFRGDVNVNNSAPGLIGGTNKKPPVRPKLPLDTLKSSLIRNEFDLGNIFFTEMNRPDSAAFYYTDILNNYPGSDYEARALYALGIYYETSNDSVKADSLYSIIYNKYRSEKVVNAAATKLNKPFIDFEFDPAKELYADAESDFIKKNFAVSLNKLYNISNKYPKSPMAAKALFASGWILENDMNLNDSAAAVYDTLSARYPKSIYSNSVAPKLYVYKDEIKKKKMAVQDSLLKIEQEILKKKSLDSLSRSPGFNNKKTGIDSLNNNVSIVDSLKKYNKSLRPDSSNYNKQKDVNIESLKKSNNFLIPDSLNPHKNKGVTSDSLHKDAKKSLEP